MGNRGQILQMGQINTFLYLFLKIKHNIIYPFMPFILFYILVSTSCSNYGVALITKCLVNMMNIVTMGI